MFHFFLRILWIHALLTRTATISTLEQTSTCTRLLNFLLHCSTYIVAYVLSLLICSLHTKNSERRFQPKFSFGPPSPAVDTVVKMLYQLYLGLLFLDLQSPLPWWISIISIIWKPDGNLTIQSATSSSKYQPFDATSTLHMKRFVYGIDVLLEASGDRHLARSVPASSWVLHGIGWRRAPVVHPRPPRVARCRCHRMLRPPTRPRLSAHSHAPAQAATAVSPC